MTLHEENILQTLVQETSLHNVSKEQLQQVINQYPYYNASYFLLAKKLYLQKETHKDDVLQKAALQFSNDLWFRFNLTDEEAPENAALHELITSPNEPVDTGEENESGAPGTDKEELTESNAAVKEDINEKLSSMLQQQAAQFDKPVEATTEIPVEITPYHRVDYFDSQGIKLEEGKNPDKLEAQLKRFTDWLKQMKRISPNPVDLGNDEAGETQVQHIAEHSNEAGEIVTETMAEVLVKQGKPEQAIQIYEKLSFNNPSKSAYFAAKIEELKN
jgi:hypothetical protein